MRHATRKVGSGISSFWVGRRTSWLVKVLLNPSDAITVTL